MATFAIMCVIVCLRIHTFLHKVLSALLICMPINCFDRICMQALTDVVSVVTLLPAVRSVSNQAVTSIQSRL